VVVRGVVLDSGPLGLLTNPRPSKATQHCTDWLAELISAGVEFFLPEIADYEVRRELLRTRRRKAIHRLDGLARRFLYLPIDTSVMRRAAELWAQARHSGQPTAGDENLDADMILVAQAELTDCPA
jgi:predicted nucleic acid-binding protein